MKILYIGDIMGELGQRVVGQVLPDLRKELKPDLVIAQAENVTEAKGISVADYNNLRAIGIDFFTGGNWSLFREESFSLFSDPRAPIIRPANYPDSDPGLGYKYIGVSGGQVLVISLLGKIVGKDADKFTHNPLETIDNILEAEKEVNKKAVIVNFHGDYSSEKVVIGQYLDGKVTAVIGDHWHVPSADARVLEGGTAHITDVGMCGALNGSLGVSLEVITNRWRHGTKNKNELVENGPTQFNAVLIESDDKTGLASSIEQIRKLSGN